jgi:hypothetical protein
MKMLFYIATLILGIILTLSCGRTQDKKRADLASQAIQTSGKYLTKKELVEILKYNSQAATQAWLERRDTTTDEQVAQLEAIVRTYFSGAHFIDVNGDSKVGVEDIVWVKDAGGNINFQRVDKKLADRVRVDAAVVRGCYLMAKAHHVYGIRSQVRVSTAYWEGTLQPGFYQVRQYVRGSDAVNDIFENPKQYRFGDSYATTIVYLKAMLDLLGPTDFDRVVPSLTIGPFSLTPFVTQMAEVTGNTGQNADAQLRSELRAGDESYFLNPSASDDAKKARSDEQYAIYLGDGKWYAHPFGITTEEAILEYLNRSSDSEADQLARMTRMKTRMRVEILTQPKKVCRLMQWWAHKSN